MLIVVIDCHPWCHQHHQHYHQEYDKYVSWVESIRSGMEQQIL